MKKLSLLFSLVFITAALLFTGCKKDKTAPVITLTGDETIELPLDGTFQEPGFTAADDEDGDLSAEVTVEGTVDESKIGTYVITYTVMDAAGNAATINRTVIIKIMQENYVGAFTVGDNCGGLISIDSDQTVAAGAGATEISFSPLFNIVGGTMQGTIVDQTITIASQDVAGTTVSGSGTINDNASVIILQMSMDPPLGSALSCTLTYTRM